MIFAILPFIWGTVLWVLDKSYNPAVDYGIGMILLGMSLSLPTDSDTDE